MSLWLIVIKRVGKVGKNADFVKKTSYDWFKYCLRIKNTANRRGLVEKNPLFIFPSQRAKTLNFETREGTYRPIP